MKATLTCTFALVASAFAAEPTPLPLTLEGAARAVTVERGPITDELRALAGEGEGSLEGMKYHYRVHYRTWDGAYDETASYVSAHAYTQGYAHGDALVLTNSGAAEAPPMRLALFTDGDAQEITLPAKAYAQKAACLGTAPVGRFTWHRREGWQGRKGGLSLHPGSSEYECKLQWSYDAETGDTDFGVSTPEGWQELEQQKAPFRSVGMPSLGASGSSVPQPADAGAPTPLAVELPVTHERAACPLRVECVEQPADSARPHFRYIVREAAYNHGTRLCFTSRHRYGQAYAHGKLLLLSTSGAHCTWDDGVMAFIVLDLTKVSAIEDVLALEAWERCEVASEEGFCNWDGVDDEGNWVCGSYSWLDWHAADAMSGNAKGLSVRLGTQLPDDCRIWWHYAAATATTRLRNRRLTALFDGELPHQTTPIEVEVRYAGAEKPAAAE